MDVSLVPFTVEAAERVPDDRAGLKDVYILTTEDGQCVFSQDTGTGWNWLTGDYVEPLVVRWVHQRDATLSPAVLAHDVSEKWMVTQYIGVEDFRDGMENAPISEYEALGATLGRVHQLNGFDKYGGFLRTGRGTIEPQHTSWNETLVALIENRSTVPKDTDGVPIDETMITAFQNLDTDIVPQCFSHGDFNPRNIRVNANREIVGLVDWQNAWISDGLSEFFYRRLRLADNPPKTDPQTAAFTRGYRRTCPFSVLGVTPEQATASYVTALARAYDWREGAIDAELVFEQYGSLDETLSLETLLGSGRASHLSTFEE